MLTECVHVAFREFDAGRPSPTGIAQWFLTFGGERWRRKFCHVDLILPCGRCLGVSARSGRVEMRERFGWSAGAYTQFAAVPVQPGASSALREFAWERDGSPFSLPAAAWNWTAGRAAACLRIAPPRAWYCTRLVLRGLLSAGIGGLDPLTATPEDIYRWCGRAGWLLEYGSAPDGFA